MLSLFQKYRTFFLYSLIGVVSASADFIIFTILAHVFQVNYLVANFFSTNFGILNSFLLNRKFNFRTLDKKFERLVKFYSVGISGLFLSSFLLWLSVGTFGLNATIAKLSTLPIVVIFQFSMNKLLTFKKTYHQT